MKITRSCNAVLVRATIRRGLPGERIHIPRSADAAIWERAEHDPLELTAQRVELRRRDGRQHQRENQASKQGDSDRVRYQYQVSRRMASR